MNGSLFDRLRCVPAAVLLLAASPVLSHEPVISRNLAANPSFDVMAQDGQWPAGWSGDRQVYGVCRETVRSGPAALRYSNDDPQRYRLATQRIGLQPGGKYRISVWVKTQDLRGDDSGATGLIFYSWYDIGRNPDVPQSVQWERLKRIAAEIDRYAAVLLSAEPAPVIHVAGDNPDSPCPP
ncbi:MAG: hypothetical protein EA424_14885 [Planctomycetaceae bacterium]|nr:MAG: hypothetical protein EA424_14885 [Planctomycetaceae bacterium]